MLIEFPETHTVSTRLTFQDYKALRSLCSTNGLTIHKVVRLLVGRWMIEKSREYRTPVRLSDRLKNQVERERDKPGGVFPGESLAAKAAAALAQSIELSERVEKSI